MKTPLAIVAGIMLAAMSHAESAPASQQHVLLTGGIAYQWADDEGAEESWWSAMAAVDWFMPGPYVGVGINYGPRVAFEYEGNDLGNDSRVIGLNASLGYTFGNWTPFVRIARDKAELNVEVDGRRVSLADWSDPSYAIGTWYRGNESTQFHTSVRGLAADDSEAGLFTGFRAMPTSTRFVFWGDIGYAPPVKGISFGLGVGVRLGPRRR